MSGGGRDSSRVNAVFYAAEYHPIQAGSIDGTDVLPHDNAVYRAHLCSSAGLYDPFGDPNVIGDPYCTVFVGRLSHLTNEDSLRKAMSKYGNVKNLRLVRHIVTGASRGYAFVEYETDREMRRAFKNAHHSIIDDSEVIVDYNRQQLMPGWIPRRLGGGLGGKKESGQLRFGGRERPFRAPLRPIPWDDLERLGIPPPPEGKYLSRFEIPSPPRRKGSSLDREDSFEKSHNHIRNSQGRERSASLDHRYDNSEKRYKHHRNSSLHERSTNHDNRYETRSSMDREDSTTKSNKHSSDPYRSKRRSTSRDLYSDHRSSVDGEESSRKSHKRSRDSHRSSVDREERSRKSHKHNRDSHGSRRRSTSRDLETDKRSMDREEFSRNSHKHSRDSHRSKRRSSSRDIQTDERSSVDGEDGYKKSHKHGRKSNGRERSISRGRRSERSVDSEAESGERHKRRKHSHGKDSSRDRGHAYDE